MCTQPVVRGGGSSLPRDADRTRLTRPAHRPLAILHAARVRTNVCQSVPVCQPSPAQQLQRTRQNVHCFSNQIQHKKHCFCNAYFICLVLDEFCTPHNKNLERSSIFSRKRTFFRMYNKSLLQGDYTRTRAIVTTTTTSVFYKY